MSKNLLSTRTGAFLAAMSALPVHAADKLFAAPETSNVAASSAGASLSKVTLSLVVVLAFVFVAAWVMKQARKLQQTKGAAGIEIVAQVALGAKERAVLLKVRDAHILVGVAPGQVNALHVMPSSVGDVAQSTVDIAPTPSESSPAPLTFQAVLKRSLGLS